MKTKSINIARDFVVIDADKTATVEKNDAELYQRLNLNYDGFKGCELISLYEFGEDWSSWEMHPNGDEVVVLLSGKVDFLLKRDVGEDTVTLSNNGDYVIVPKGMWHTAKVTEESKVLFITPGEGTQNKDI